MKGPEEDAGLAGKVAIVSGGGATGDGIGNGRAAAILLARAGTKVVVSDLDKKLAQRTVEMIQAEGGTAVAEACDATREADCKRLVDAAGDRWGRVNCICPGPMYTPMVNRGNGMSEANRAQRAKASVLKIEGTGWDIGYAVRFLMSGHARYITGQVLVVDGGVTLQGPARESQDN